MKRSSYFLGVGFGGIIFSCRLKKKQKQKKHTSALFIKSDFHKSQKIGWYIY
jgi:hypothetical protein